MYSCRWAYCAAICDSLLHLEEHVSTHIAHSTPIKLLGVKRMKIAPETWVRVDDSQNQILSSFKGISDHLPPHNSQAGDTTITTDTTYPIPSFNSLPPPPSFPSPPPFSAYDHLDPSADPFSDADVFRNDLGGRVMDDDLVMSDEMLLEFLRSPSPDPPSLARPGVVEEDDTNVSSSQSPVRSLGRAISPFIPPTQAILPSQLDTLVTQSTPDKNQAAAEMHTTSAGELHNSAPPSQPNTSSLPTTTPARPRPTPTTLPDTSPQSLEIGRSANTNGKTVNRNLSIAANLQTPANPDNTSARSSLGRQDTAPGLPITFGSAITPDSPAQVLAKMQEKPMEKGRMSLGGFGTPGDKAARGPRSSVGFTFGSRLASPSDKR